MTAGRACLAATLFAACRQAAENGVLAMRVGEDEGVSRLDQFGALGTESFDIFGLSGGAQEPLSLDDPSMLELQSSAQAAIDSSGDDAAAAAAFWASISPATTTEPPPKCGMVDGVLTPFKYAGEFSENMEQEETEAPKVMEAPDVDEDEDDESSDSRGQSMVEEDDDDAEAEDADAAASIVSAPLQTQEKASTSAAVEAERAQDLAQMAAATVQKAEAQKRQALKKCEQARVEKKLASKLVKKAKTAWQALIANVKKRSQDKVAKASAAAREARTNALVQTDELHSQTVLTAARLTAAKAKRARRRAEKEEEAALMATKARNKVLKDTARAKEVAESEARQASAVNKRVQEMAETASATISAACGDMIQPSGDACTAQR